MPKVFVYGTLKKGYRNHPLLHGYGERSELLAEDSCEGVLYNTPYGFPAAVKGMGVIVGEVYEVTPETLKRLDRLEGHPQMYTRTEVKLDSGTKAFVYFWNGDPENYNGVKDKAEPGWKELSEGVWPEVQINEAESGWTELSEGEDE